jgi:hypothetical protein
MASFFTGKRPAAVVPAAVPARSSMLRRAFAYLGSEETAPYRSAALKFTTFLVGVVLVKNFGDALVLVSRRETRAVRMGTYAGWSPRHVTCVSGGRSLARFCLSHLRPDPSQPAGPEEPASSSTPATSAEAGGLPTTM